MDMPAETVPMVISQLTAAGSASEKWAPVLSAFTNCPVLRQVCH